MRFQAIFGPVAALTVILSGCDVSSAVEDLNDQAIQASFDTIKATAEQNGGAAMMVTPGAAATLTVSNPASPLDGATVVVPAGAIPSDVENAVVAIQDGAVRGEIEYPVYAGPSALVILRKLPLLEDITPAVPLTLALPYYADATTYPAAELVLGAIDVMEGGAPVKLIEGSKADEAKKQVSGGVSDLKLPFAGVWPVTFAGGPAQPGTLIYSVTKADGTVCAGFKADPEDLSPSITISAPGFLEMSVVVGNMNSVEAVATLSNPVPVPTAATTFPLDASTSTFTCDGQAYTAEGATVIKLETVFSDWVETQAVPSAQTCNMWASTYCYTHHGQVTIGIELDFTTPAGDHVMVSANKRSAGMNWTNTTNNP